jgi:hypothetical protein
MIHSTLSVKNAGTVQVEIALIAQQCLPSNSFTERISEAVDPGV